MSLVNRCCPSLERAVSFYFNNPVRSAVVGGTVAAVGALGMGGVLLESIASVTNELVYANLPISVGIGAKLAGSDNLLDAFIFGAFSLPMIGLYSSVEMVLVYASGSDPLPVLIANPIMTAASVTAVGIGAFVVRSLRGGGAQVAQAMPQAIPLPVVPVILPPTRPLTPESNV